jgi:putative glutamine amidotransferase
MARPLIAIPGRFSKSASALRYQALVVARRLSAGVIAAGGEPLIVHPVAPGGRVSVDEIAERLSWADAVLLPGGGDLDPRTYGEAVESDHVYDVDVEQDAFDLAVAQWALENAIPTLAICRGMQVVNVALGGTLEQHMDEPHRPHVEPGEPLPLFTHEVKVDAGTHLNQIVGDTITSSCYHHQRVAELAPGMVATAHAFDGTFEGLERPDSAGWFVAVQWHPEDTVSDDPLQLSLLRALVAAAR